MALAPLDLGPNAHLIGKPGSRGALDTPVLVIDLDALERNIATMAAHVRQVGQVLRPHAKTHKSLEIARRQVAAGAVGIACATLGEAEVMVGGGIENVLITSPMVRASKVERLIALNRRANGLSVVVDHPGNIEALAAAANASGQVLRVLIDLDVGTHRTGVASAQSAVALARQIAGQASLELVGLQAYAGHLQHVVDYDARLAQARQMAEWLSQVRGQLSAAGLSPALLSGGGTGTHDLDHRAGAINELQAGSYVFMDSDYGVVALTEAGRSPFETALFVQTSVVSACHDGFVTTDAGLKAFSTDKGPPDILSGAPAGSTYSWSGDEHGRVHLPPGGRLDIDAVLECRVPHCDPTVNLHDHYHVVRGDTLVAIWPVDARGRR
ncbi:MAG: DSD1 family PLP-dependent enzyme [Alphaproteobacteria bacterium]|nr:DSD1 family PLP-dependent enzyme [Alphaproteobacteria bacterium]